MASPTPIDPPSSATAAAASPEAADPGTASPAAPELPAQAQAAASELGYDAAVGDLGCDRGAAEALGHETGSGQTWAAATLYFATLEEAEVVRDAAQHAGTRWPAWPR